MIKIDWTQIIRDSEWLGWAYIDNLVADDELVCHGYWAYSPWWFARLWPIPRSMRDDKFKPYPRWWLKIFGVLRD